MSQYDVAIAVIGYKIPAGHLELPIPPTFVCPECGCKARKGAKVPVYTYQETHDGYYIERPGTPGGSRPEWFEVFFDNQKAYAVISIMSIKKTTLAHDSFPSSVSCGDFSSIEPRRERLRRLLCKYGLYQFALFGLHVILARKHGKGEHK